MAPITLVRSHCEDQSKVFELKDYARNHGYSKCSGSAAVGLREAFYKSRLNYSDSGFRYEELECLLNANAPEC